MAVTRGLFQSGYARRQKLVRKLESACAISRRSTLPKPKFPGSRKTNNSRRSGRACSISRIAPTPSTSPSQRGYIVFLSAITSSFYGVLGLAFGLIYVWGNGYGVFSDSLVASDLLFCPADTCFQWLSDRSILGGLARRLLVNKTWKQ